MWMKRIFIAAILGAALFMSMALLSNVGPMERQLHDAAATGDSRQIAVLLSQGANIDARNALMRTPLMLATRANHIEAAKLLINAGADVNAKDAIQDSPYLYAGARGHLEILQMTLNNGADLASTNRYGGTAIIPAAERGHVETVRTLIQAGTDIDQINYLGWTALLEAIILADGGPRHIAIVQLLLDAGANVNLADKDGITPLQHARQRGYTEMVNILEKAGAK
ncbi:ankyrin repeat domain-containing protein [Rheinheimera salexigens]|uniref:Uncharacterized protein n=2 Tax=Rheinheimera salexigens TaxID=1628148 RepID=A0A1E7Q8V4_9GAMM|nr:hypothetical protein BI198_13500 [Rheinheimera salexigens]